jgi:hypothetical protein
MSCGLYFRVCTFTRLTVLIPNDRKLLADQLLQAQQKYRYIVENTVVSIFTEYAGEAPSLSITRWRLCYRLP